MGYKKQRMGGKSRLSTAWTEGEHAGGLVIVHTRGDCRYFVLTHLRFEFFSIAKTMAMSKK